MATWDKNWMIQPWLEKKKITIYGGQLGFVENYIFNSSEMKGIYWVNTFSLWFDFFYLFLVRLAILFFFIPQTLSFSGDHLLF